MARVYEVQNANYADLTVEVVPTAVMADLSVFRDDGAMSQNWAEQIWSFVGQRHNAQVSVYLKQPDHMGADLRVAFVPRRALAGWTRHHRLQGRLCRLRPAASAR
ncbi:MAG: hypothetical protein HUJ24_01780 [Rhodobacteraceae bacterium]|nr:hypothetical protein [Paracoccaceae bacterium]